jgi:MoxR-like ATPase
MHVGVDYPTPEQELEVLRLVRGEEGGTPAYDEAPIPQEAVFAARAEVHSVHVAEAIEQYIVGLVFGTRRPEAYGDELKAWIEVGSSPRATLGLDRCARAHAWLRGRDHVTPDDVRAVAHDVLRHRLILSYEAHASGVTPDRVIDALVQQVAVA